MRFVLTALLSGSLAAGLSAPTLAAPADYHPPRHFYTPGHQPYRRLPTRLALGFNLASYNGDLTGRLRDNTLRLGLSLGLVRTLSPHLTFGADLGFVRLRAVDQFPDRAYRFGGTDAVLTTYLRYNILADKSMYIGLNNRPTTWQPFLQAGVGGMVYNPSVAQATPFGNVLLPAEGNNTASFSGVAAVLPVGAGVTLRASRSLYFTLEGLYYFTSTDLLDGISQRGNPKSNDSFMTATLKIEYAFYKKSAKPLVHFD
ncbi:hypothetical protein [Hymenobacter bucti]|uniref:Outer membrane protein beta-barrel domain-containing protein n=1 Tax=Hymenobacter bucti TaxID=1844114 RepID=A0ABW4QVN8_9BACT